MLVAQGIHKTYGKKENAYVALRGINLKVKDGESIAIVGKSGSGKSTLMHLLAGLDRPDEGTISYDDRILSDMNEAAMAAFHNHSVGFVFQQFYLQPSVSVLENVTLPLKVRGVRSGERTRIGKSMLKKVGLEDKVANKANDLSGGQKQRVAIARALVSSPQIIFADEPTGNLDSDTADQVMALLLKLHKQENVTLIIVTHDLDIAQLCDRQIHLKDGAIVK
jgi:putative ABC transport system ATP-binding protein